MDRDSLLGTLTYFVDNERYVLSKKVTWFFRRRNLYVMGTQDALGTHHKNFFVTMYFYRCSLGLLWWPFYSICKYLAIMLYTKINIMLYVSYTLIFFFFFLVWGKRRSGLEKQNKRLLHMKRSYFETVNVFLQLLYLLLFSCYHPYIYLFSFY